MCTKTALGLSRETLLTFTGANLLLKYDILIYINYDSMILSQKKICTCTNCSLLYLCM